MNRKCIFSFGPDYGAIITNSIILFALGIIAIRSNLFLLLIFITIFFLLEYLFLLTVRKIYFYDDCFEISSVIGKKQKKIYSYSDLKEVKFYFPTFRGKRALIFNYFHEGRIVKKKFYVDGYLPKRELLFLKAKGIELCISPPERSPEFGL